MYYMIVNLHWEGDIGRQFVFHRLDSGTLNSIFFIIMGEARGLFLACSLVNGNKIYLGGAVWGYYIGMWGQLYLN